MYFLGDPGKDLKCLEMAKNGHDGVPVFWRTTRFLPLPSTYYVDMKQNLYKDNLKFIQYSNATCLPLNLDLASKKDLLTAKVLISSRNKLRKAASVFKTKGANVDNYFVCSEYEFHRTRLSGFNSKSILTIQQINQAILNLNIKLSDIKNLFKL